VGFITSVSAYPENLELREPYSISSGTQTRAEYVVAVVKDSDGHTGFGEASPMPGYSDETQASILESIRRNLAGIVIRPELKGISSLIEAMDGVVSGESMAKSAVEVALTDLLTRKLQLSLIDYLGGPVRNEIGIAGGIGFMAPQAAAKKAGALIASGVTTIKVKIGRSIETDVDLVGAIREEAGGTVGLRLDANQAYSAETAVAKLRRLERFDPLLFEQPVGKGELNAMAKIAKAIDTPIMADEPIQDAKDVVEYATAGAADLVKVKVNKCGGIRKTLFLCDVARLYGMRVVIGSGHESSIGVAVEAALAMTNSNFDPVGEMNGNQRLEAEWTTPGLFPVRGKIRPWNRPGLGLDIIVPPVLPE
jgi:o-succinylbenzoate synthase